MSAAFDFLRCELLSMNLLLSTTVLHPGPAKGLLTNFCEVLVSGSAFFLSFSDSLQVTTYTASFTAGIAIDEDDDIYTFSLRVHQLMELFVAKAWYRELLEHCNTELERLHLAYPRSSHEPSPPTSHVSSGATSPAVALLHVNSPVADVPTSAEGSANERMDVEPPVSACHAHYLFY